MLSDRGAIGPNDHPSQKEMKLVHLDWRRTSETHLAERSAYFWA